jgi:hypothetical protein
MTGIGGSTNKSGVNLDYTLGNVYQVKFQYLGFGNAYFFIENPLQGQMVLVHSLQYPNTTTTQNLRNPSFPFRLESRNFNNSSNIAVKTASVGLFIEGDEAFLGPIYGSNSTKSTITTETSILSIKNCSSLNGITNRSNVYLSNISYSSTAASPNGIIILKIIRNAALGGSPNWIAVDGIATNSGLAVTAANSGISTDSAGTTVTGGTTVFNGASYVSGNVSQDISGLKLFIGPGETFTFSISSTQSASVAVAATWVEDI